LRFSSGEEVLTGTIGMVVSIGVGVSFRTKLAAISLPLVNTRENVETLKKSQMPSISVSRLGIFRPSTHRMHRIGTRTISMIEHNGFWIFRPTSHQFHSVAGAFQPGDLRG
jgi:hypothetical protein